MSKFITVINMKTGEDVAFTYLENGEIQITSPYEHDTEENCKVIVSKTMYITSWDYDYFLECIKNGRLNAKAS